MALQEPKIVDRLSHRRGMRIVGGKNGGALFESDSTIGATVTFEGWDWAAVENSTGERVYIFGNETSPARPIKQASQ